ncbi:MAG: hypothetical protein OXU86_06295 [Thaumarchaeota archaeon]|nr:hypothetical protein [Nitrososphaerota archaeon]
MVLELIATSMIVGGVGLKVLLELLNWSREGRQRRKAEEQRREEARKAEEQRREEARKAEEQRREERERRRDAQIVGLVVSINKMTGMQEAAERRHGEDRKAAERRHEIAEQRREEDRNAAERRHEIAEQKREEDRKAAEERHEAQQRAIAMLVVDMAEFKVRLDGLYQMHRDGMKVQEKAIADLAGRLDHMGKRLDGVEKRVDALGERVGALDERVGALDERVGALGERVADMAVRLSHLEAEFASFREAVLPRAVPPGERPGASRS